MKTKRQNRPTNFNPNDSDYVSRNKNIGSSGGTGQNYSSAASGTKESNRSAKSQQTDSAAIKIKGALTKMDETHS
jgi:hypothetical protein